MAAMDYDEDDNLSTTSTISEEFDAEQDWDVETLLAQRFFNGQDHILIEWTGYPLHRATWEPMHTIGPGNLADWKTRKKGYKSGTIPKFNIRAWKQAVEDAAREKQVRQRNRNSKRERLGERKTPVDDIAPLLESLGNISDESDSEDEAPVAKAPRERGSQRGASGQEQPPDRTETLSPPNAGTTSSSAPSPSVPTQDKNVAPKASEKTNPRPTSSNTKLRDNLPPLQTRPQPPRRPSSDISGNTTPIGSTKASRPGQSSTNAPGESATRQPNPRKHSTADTTNVFSGGKVRKARSTLLDAASDSTKQPKILKSRYQRQIETRRRDKEGTTAPAKFPSKFIALGQGMKERSTTKTGGDQPIARDSSPNPILLMGADATKKKAARRKAVHWEDQDTPDPMDVDHEESLFVSDPQPTTQSVRLKSPPMPSASGDASAGIPSRILLGSQSISKMVQIGPDTSKSFSINFTGMPEDPNLKWLSKFKQDSRLTFKYTCTAQDLKSQQTAQDVQLSEGFISSDSAQATMEALASRLAVGSLGVFHYHEDYCVLIYPFKCEDWAAEGFFTPVHAKDQPLRYLIFKPNAGVSLSMLAPITHSAAAGGGDVKLARTMDVSTFCGVTYEQLLPSDLRISGQAHFFLAFPKSRDQENLLLSRWLRQASPDCQISSSTRTGHWSKFVTLDSGIVIIHEDATWAIRRFPEFAKLLHSPVAKFKFWHFSRALQPLAMFPSTRSPRVDLGDLRLFPVFQPDMVILITPSFLVSEPEQAFVFVKWFASLYKNTTGSGKLLACAGVDQWVSELATWENQGRGPKPKEEALEARLKTCSLLRELMSDSTRAGVVDGPLECAPDLIDGSDEQSLVNWFGWWSIMHMDRFRQFCVLGSSGAYPRRGYSRMLKTLRYQAGTINDPDQVDMALDLEELSMNPEGQTSLDGRTAPSQLVPDESPRALKEFMADVVKRITRASWCPIVLYYIPVAYWFSDMAYDSGDYRSEFASFDAWFRYFRYPGAPPMAYFNTFVGFFQTIEGKWDPNARKQGAYPVRRPWLAIYRPVQPHMRPWKSSELFIWDLTAREKFGRDEKLYEADLIEAQRRLIDHIKEHGQASNFKLRLEKVWLGGFEHEPSNYTNPVDVTLYQLQALIDNVKMMLPSPEAKIPTAGWRPVVAGQRPHDAADHRMDLDEPVVQDETDLKMIFHPPRGSGLTAHSACKNDLYREARRAAGMGLDGFEYTFRPTREWYMEQHAEGRGFEHIQVTGWGPLFEQLRISKSE